MPVYYIEEMGGWENRALIDEFVAFARLCFTEYRGRVKYWITFNEINVLLMLARDLPNDAEKRGRYLELHNQLVASARAVRLAHEMDPGCLVGSMNCGMFTYPLTCAPADVAANQKYRQDTFFYSADVQARGYYPSYARRIWRENDVQLDISAQDEADLRAGRADYFAFSYYCANRITMQVGADILHLDLMDGQFVPNFGMGLQDIEYLCRHSGIPCDVHMMCMTPGEYVERLVALGAQILYIHPEADRHAARTLQKIADAGARPGIAIDPGTAVETIEPLLNLADYVLVMTVNPGFAGQQYIGFVEDKIDRLVTLKAKYGFRIMIDGAGSPQVIARLSKKGVEGYILGTSALFGKGRPYREILRELRGL